MATDVTDYEQESPPGLSLDDLGEVARAIRDEVKDMISAHFKEVEPYLVGRLSEVLERKLTQSLQAMEQRHLQAMEKITQGSEGLMAQVIAAIQALPRPDIDIQFPDVNVAAPQVSVQAPTVQVMPADVQVTFQPPAMTVTPPDVKVTVEAPTVYCEPAVVNVDVQVPVRKSRKHISYDEFGRPATIEEEG